MMIKLIHTSVTSFTVITFIRRICFTLWAMYQFLVTFFIRRISESRIWRISKRQDEIVDNHKDKEDIVDSKNNKEKRVFAFYRWYDEIETENFYSRQNNQTYSLPQRHRICTSIDLLIRFWWFFTCNIKGRSTCRLNHLFY